MTARHAHLRPAASALPLSEQVRQLKLVVRAYQHANGPEQMAAADAMAVALIGPAPLEEQAAPKAKRAKVKRT